MNLYQFINILNLNSVNRNTKIHQCRTNNISYLSNIFKLNVEFSKLDVKSIVEEGADCNLGKGLDYFKYRIPDNINQKESEDFDAFLLRWPKNASSPVHDHPARGCFMKVLEGMLKERFYDSDTDTVNETLMRVGDFGFIKGEQKHLIKNVGDREAYSLHIYGK